MSSTSRTNPDQPFSPARLSKAAWITISVVTLVGLVGDLWTKSLAFERVASTPVLFDRQDVLEVEHLGLLIPPHDPVQVIPNLLELTLVLNPGAVFGMGAGKRWFFIAFTIAAMGICLWMFGWWTSRRDRMAHISFGLVIAGGLGNLYDRLLYACVRDFIHPLPGVRLPFGVSWPSGEREVWPYVSNVADAYLIVGITALVWFSFRTPSHPSPETHPEIPKPPE